MKFWVGYKLKKDGSKVCDGFDTKEQQLKKQKELEDMGYTDARLFDSEEEANKYLSDQYFPKSKFN